MDKEKREEFLSLFRDPLFVAIPNKGGFVFHSKDINKVLERNTQEIMDGAYFTVNGFKNFIEGDYHGRTKANVTSFNANFLDIDLTPETRHMQAEIIYKELCDKNLRPTAVVLTGKGLHVYWVYKEPFSFSDAKLVEYEVLQTAIVEHYATRGADRQARDVARVLRIPGAMYFNKQGEHTCDVELLYLNPNSLYEPKDIVKYFGTEIKMDTKAGEELLRLGDDFDFATILNVKKGSRHHNAYSAALSIIQRTKDLASARKMYQAILSTWESPKNDPMDWRDMWSQFESAKKTIEREMPQAFIGDKELPSINIVMAKDVEMQPIEWLWDGFIAKGKAHMLTGEPGLGKSQITIDIASRFSTGTALPAYTLGKVPHDPIGVLILSAEDGAADTMVPRLVAAGADLSNVGFLSSSLLEKGKDKSMRMRSLSLLEDAEQILKAITTLPMKIGLIIIDPISAFLSNNQDSNSNSDARSTLAQLQNVIMDKGIAMLMINHTNKNTAAKSAHMRSMGSVGWNAAARATFYVFKDPQDDERRIFSIGKMNLAKESGKGFFYRVKDKMIPIAGNETSIPFIEWDKNVFPTKSADEYVSQPSKSEKIESEDCKTELEMFLLAQGKIPSKKGLQYMKERGFSQAEIYRAVRKLNALSVEYGFWDLPVVRDVS